MEHGTPTPDPEGLIPHGLDQNPSEKSELQQTRLQTEIPQVKLDPSEMPYNWPARKKWSATLVVVFMTATITFASSIHASTIGGVLKTFRCLKTIAILGVTTFLLRFATGPLLFALLSKA